MLLRLVLSTAGVVIGAQLLRYIYRLVHWHMFSPFRYMPGPPNPSLLYGNFGRVTFPTTQKWQAEYGPTFKFHNFLSVSSMSLYTIDTVALHRIVNNSEIYQKAPMVRFNMTLMLGKGEPPDCSLLRTMSTPNSEKSWSSPAFGPSQVHGLTQLFLDKSLELSEFWAQQPQDESGWAHLDVLAGLKAITLDIIGLAGFNYQFNSLDTNKEPTELDEAFKKVFLQGGNRQPTPFTILRARFPILLPLLPPPKRLTQGRGTMDRIGKQLLQDAKNAVASGEKLVERKDLLSLLVRSNMAKDIPESHRLSDDVVVAQLPTFFVAGHETTSTATTWALYALALHPEVQATLRAELQTMGTDSPSLDALNSLQYLDKVVREVMRIHSPVVFTNRMAMRDDVIPLGTPYTDTRGKQHDSIVVSKGQMIYVPVAALNRDTRIWGADAAEFKPDRWDAVPEAANSIPGVWSHLFSFLGGPHNCIGWRFSLAEMKCLLYTLIRTFEFELAVSPEELTVGRTAVQRPMLISDPTKPQLPMRMRRVQV
ncbi:Cytochrome P450 [Mycena sanguinolenta]|uniref:Cytochrome P450 n=1 Tax=Mycena sanguinolenta TaxID=230812 RepID=A0A8H7D1N8_9AGAR|nr:Cytochrome P450 [Mycena sanguinolenta]